jgi:hypothetical protein
MLRRAAFLAIAMSLVIAPGRVSAQTTADASRKWEILDNSFFVEEAFNQEAGVVQNIFTWSRTRDGAWDLGFTQEWPAPGMRHQLSYTILFASTGSVRGFGDVMLNYRYQLREETAGGPAIAPRVSLIIPTGSEADGSGGGASGVQVNVPLSKQFGDFYFHANVGHTWVRDAVNTPHIAGSGIWRMKPMINLMLEAVVEFGDSTTVSPGLRGGWNLGDHQLILGAAVPFTRSEQRTTAAILAYVSYELPFRR